MHKFIQKADETPQQKSDKSTAPGLGHFEHNHDDMRSTLVLQRTLGNQAVQRLLQTHTEKRNLVQTGAASPNFGNASSQFPVTPPKTGVIQTKLSINTPGDEFEQEADRIAERVMRMPEPRLHNARTREGAFPNVKANRLGQERGRLLIKPVQTGNNEQVAASSIVHDALRSSGQPLPPDTRAFMENRFGHDFSQVRIHTDKKAAESAHALNARAFTEGRNIHFRAGQYDTQSNEGKRLLAHELTHVVQQTTGGIEPHIQRQVSADIRAEADLPSNQRTPGRLGQLETQARGETDQAFQHLIGAQPLQPGTTGRATQMINHIAGQIGQLENARARGYQQAVSAMLGQQTLNAPQASSFWLAFAGNTLWALSGLVPLLGPVVGVSRIALAAGGGVMLETNAIGRFLQAGGGAVATAVVGLAGAEMAQFSGGTPSGSSLPRTLQDIQTTFTNENSRVMSRYRSEAFAFTLDFLRLLSFFISPLNTVAIGSNFLEIFAKGCVMETLFADLNNQGILDQSNYTIDAGRAQQAAKNDLLQAFVLRFGTVRDVAFQTSRDEIGDRLGATGTSAALSALGGESTFARRLQGNHELVLGNVNGLLADWGATNTMSNQSQQAWSSGTTLASGTHTVPFAIQDKG